MAIKTKVCCRCKKELPLAEFYNNKTRYDGKQSFCIACKRKSNQKWWKSKSGRERRKHYHLQSRFGMTIDEYKQILKSQNTLCAVCGCPETWTIDGTPRDLSVDHCHRTGKIRQLLCSRCNKVLGFIDDDSSLLEKLIEYLKFHKEI